MSITTQLTHSSQAWNYLRGLVCVYKPPRYSLGSVLRKLRYNVAEDLNCMERTYSDNEDIRKIDSSESNNFNALQLSSNDELLEIESKSNVDYGNHPLVLGPAYVQEDLKTYHINKLGPNSSGLCLIGLADRGVNLGKAIQKAKLMTTYHIRGEFGRATRTGWADGKTAMCKGYQHIKAKSWLLEQMLVNITSSHQARAWNVAEIGVETEEAYQLASKGPIRPKIMTETIVCNMKLKELKLPYFMIELHCIESDAFEEQKDIVRMIEEIGLKCRTVAHVSSIRCAAIGPWTTEDALLQKQLSLQNILDNISDNRKMYKQFVRKKGGLYTPNIRSKNSKPEGLFLNNSLDLSLQELDTDSINPP